MTGWPNPPNTFYIKSAVDEAVIAHTARSEHWIKLNYENIKSSSSFITVDNFGKPVINLTQLAVCPGIIEHCTGFCYRSNNRGTRYFGYQYSGETWLLW